MMIADYRGKGLSPPEVYEVVAECFDSGETHGVLRLDGCAEPDERSLRLIEKLVRPRAWTVSANFPDWYPLN